MAPLGSESLLAAMVIVVAVCFFAAWLAMGNRPAHEAPPSLGRVRLPVRAFERLTFSALLLGASTVVVAPANDGLLVGAFVVGGALVWLARRGAFAALGSAENGDPNG